MRRTIGSLAAVVAVFFFAAPCGAQSSIQIAKEIKLSAGSEPAGICVADDGTLWVAEDRANRLAHLSADGTLLKEFPIPHAAAGASGVAMGSDGSVWFAENTAGAIGRLMPDQTFHEYPIGHPFSEPYKIVRGTDGTMWFTEGNLEFQGIRMTMHANILGSITNDGSLVEHSIAHDFAFPKDVAVDGSGNVWASETAAVYVLITPNGEKSEVAFQPPQSTGALATDASGTVWSYTSGTRDRPVHGVVALHPSQPLQLRPITVPSIAVASMIASPDGSFWWTESPGNAVGYVAKDGTYTQFTLPPPATSIIGGPQPSFLAMGRDGTVWVTVKKTDRIYGIVVK